MITICFWILLLIIWFGVFILSETCGVSLWHGSQSKFSLVIWFPPSLTKPNCQSQHVVANNSFCGTCYIFSRGRTLMYIVLWDFHSLGTGTFCVVSDFFLWFLAILKSVSTAPLVYVIFSSVVYISAARIIPMSLSSVNALIRFLTSQLFIPVTNMQKISSLFNTH